MYYSRIAADERPRNIGPETRAVAQSLRRRVRDRFNRLGVLRAFRGTAVASFNDHTGHRRRTDVGCVHSRHSRTVCKSKGKKRSQITTENTTWSLRLCRIDRFSKYYIRDFLPKRTSAAASVVRWLRFRVPTTRQLDRRTRETFIFVAVGSRGRDSSL